MVTSLLKHGRVLHSAMGNMVWYFTMGNISSTNQHKLLCSEHEYTNMCTYKCACMHICVHACLRLHDDNDNDNNNDDGDYSNHYIENYPRNLTVFN